MVLKKAFSNENEGGLNIVGTGLLLHIKLNEAVGGNMFRVRIRTLTIAKLIIGS